MNLRMILRIILRIVFGIAIELTSRCSEAVN